MTRCRTRALLISAACSQLVAIQLAGADEKRGLEIGTKVDNAFSGYKGDESAIELELINAEGDRVTRKMTGWLFESGATEKALFTITWPADQKGIHLLTWDYRDREDDQWLYLPSMKRIKRISARGRTGSFLGSEFSYEDMMRPWAVEKYRFNHLRDQKVGSRQTWVIEAFPRDKYSGYSKQIVWVDAKYVAPLRIDYYDRKGKLLKSATFKQYKQYNGRWWRAGRIEMVNHQTGKKSNFVWASRALGKSFSDDQFASGSLGN